MSTLPPPGQGLVTFTPKQEIKIGCEPRNPVMLKWCGLNGAPNFWIFGVTQVRNLDVKSGGLFAKFNENIQTADSDSEFIGKNAVPELTMGADNLDDDDVGKNPLTPRYLGLQSLLVAPKVQMLMNPQDWKTRGERWQTVKVVPAKFRIYKTSSTTHSIELTIQLVELIIQTQ